MHDRVVEQIKAAFGQPIDPEQGRWSLSRGKHSAVNVIVSNPVEGIRGPAKVWIFDPHAQDVDKIALVEIAQAEQIDALIRGIEERLKAVDLA